MIMIGGHDACVNENIIFEDWPLSDDILELFAS